MRVRELCNLVAWLPKDSPLGKEVDPKGADWNTQTDLLALIAELIDITNVIQMKVNSKPHTHVRDPISIPRPGRVAKEEEETPVQVTGAEMESWIAAAGGKVVKGK